MILSDFVIDIIFDILRGETLAAVTSPVRIRMFSAEIDKTQDLLGVNYVEVPLTSWSTATSKQIQNAVTINFGTLLNSFNGELTLSFYTAADVLLLSHTYTANIEIGTSYSIFENSLRFTLPNLEEALANFLLNYIFRGSTTGKPSAWFLELVTTSNTAYAARIALDQKYFSEVFVNELGHKSVSYGDYVFINTPTDNTINQCRLFNSSTGGTSWFVFDDLFNQNLYAGRIFEIFNNTLTVSLAPQIDLDSFLLPSEPSCVFYVDFDGRAYDTCNNATLVENTIDYNAELKLFKSECASFFASDIVEYSNFQVPAIFTAQFFVRFSTNPANRDITFIEKLSSFKLYKNAANLLRLDVGVSNILSTSWSPLVNVWYQIILTKTSNTVNMTVNNCFTSSQEINTTVAHSNAFPSNSNLLKISNLTSPILGYSNGFYVYDQVIAAQVGIQPLPKNSYEWRLLSGQVFNSLTATQWLQYC